jgi:hypothetical protein
MSTFLLPDAFVKSDSTNPTAAAPPLKPKGLACQTGASLTGVLFVLGGGIP